MRFRRRRPPGRLPGGPGRDVREEIDFYLKERARELEEKGVGPEEARRLAREAFGDPERVAREVGEVHGTVEGRRGVMIEGILRDGRHALRRLARTPGFTAVGVLTLAIAIGANAAVFAVADALFLKELPYAEPGRLVALWETNPDSRELTTVAPGNFHDWQREAASFSGIEAFNGWFPTLTGEGAAERVDGSIVTPGLFDLLGVRPALGSGFLPEHGAEGAERVVVLSHGLWTRMFGSDPGVVGRTVELNDGGYRILGVMPEGFRLPTFHRGVPAELWSVLLFGPDPYTRQFRYLQVMGRLGPGVPIDAARTELEAVAGRLATVHPENRGRTALVEPLAERLCGDQRPMLVVLLGAAGLVFLVACLNMANLLLARGLARSRELAVQAALGSGRAPLVRQLLLESLLLAAAGGATGVAGLFLGRETFQAFVAPYVTGMAEVALDGRVLAFTLAITGGAGLLFGLLPALRLSRTDLAGFLGSRGGAGERGRARDLLVAAEAALALVLVVGAGLLGRSFLRLVSIPPGFDVDHSLVFEVRPPREGYEQSEAVVAFYDGLRERLLALPGVTEAGAMSDIPFTSENRSLRLVWDPARPEGEHFEFHAIGPGYLEAAGIDLLEGRGFADADTRDAEVVFLVNRLLARRLSPGGSPVGMRAAFPDGGSELTGTVVGVVGEALDDGFDGVPEPRLYLPHAQQPNRAMWMVVRTSGDPAEVVPLVRPLVRGLDERVPVSGLRTMDAHVGASVMGPRAGALLSLVFGALALLLAALGLYGVMAHAVTRRTREMGIRAALGARSSEIVGRVIADSFRVAGLGIVAGILLSLLAGRVLSDFLFQVRPWDPAVLAAAVLTLLGATLAAAYLPARRASRADPMVAIRAD